MSRRGPGGLALRIALLTLGTVLLTGVLAAVVATRLVRHSADTEAGRTLSRLADVAQSISVESAAGRSKARSALAELHVRTGAVTPDGRLVTRAVLVRESVTPADISALVAGHDVSATRVVAGATVLVQGRPTPTGAIVLAQRRTDATAQQDAALRRFVVALVLAGVIAVAVGLVVAWRLARPLRRAAAAARALADGRRDVLVPVSGPVEVADVAAAVNGLAAALSHSEHRQREFLLTVSHDLRTPLTAIRGFAESLADGVVPPADTARAGAVMLAESQRLAGLVDDLLDLARLDAQDLRVDLAPVDLVALARDAAAVWADRCAAAGVVFVLDVPPGVVTCTTDPSRCRQALDGLFDNALRVTPGGRPIVLAVRAEAGAAVAEVRDGGPGLTDDDLAVAFDRSALHERYRGVRPVGTGLGLAIVSRIAARLGGAVQAGHAPEGGARFTIRLPATTGGRPPDAR